MARKKKNSKDSLVTIRSYYGDEISDLLLAGETEEALALMSSDQKTIYDLGINAKLAVITKRSKKGRCKIVVQGKGQRVELSKKHCPPLDSLLVRTICAEGWKALLK